MNQGQLAATFTSVHSGFDKQGYHSHGNILIDRDTPQQKITKKLLAQGHRTSEIIFFSFLTIWTSYIY